MFNKILPTGYVYGNQKISGTSEPKWLKEAGRSSEENAVENIQRIARGRQAKNPEKANYRGWIPKGEDMETFEAGGYNRVRAESKSIFAESTHEHDRNPVNAPRGGFPRFSKLDAEVGRWKGNRKETTYYIDKLYHIIVEGDRKLKPQEFERRPPHSGSEPDVKRGQIQEYIDKNKPSNATLKKAENKAREHAKNLMAKDTADEVGYKAKGIGEYSKQRIEMDTLARYKMGGKLSEKAQKYKDKYDKAEVYVKEQLEKRSKKMKEISDERKADKDKLVGKGVNFTSRHMVNHDYVLKDLKAQEHEKKYDQKREKMEKHYTDELAKWNKYKMELFSLYKSNAPDAFVNIKTTNMRNEIKIFISYIECL